MVGSWLDRRHDLDLYDLLPNPNKFDECDPDLMLNTPCSEYYSVRSFNKMLVISDAKSFSILHCNVKSLSKNLNLLEELLCSLDSKLDTLGNTQTKFGEKSISNVNIKGYNFFTRTRQQTQVELLYIWLIILKLYLALTLNLT